MTIPYVEEILGEKGHFAAHYRFSRLAIHLQNRNTGYRSEAIHADISKLLPPCLPGQDETPWSSIHLYVLPGRDILPPLHHPHYHRHPSNVSLYAIY